LLSGIKALGRSFGDPSQNPPITRACETSRFASMLG
jgi:hypothetical protein